jgi:biotin transport system substrate-specific component
VPWVILLSALLGGRFGTLLMVGYVGLGLLGVPWFANGGGWDYIYELSLGYLLGFLLVPTVMERINGLGASVDEGWNLGRFMFRLISTIAAVACVHACGVLVLSLHGLLGQLSWGEVGAWIQRYSGISWGYDMILALGVIGLARWLRVVFWMILY